MVKEKKIITRLEDNLYDEIERFSQDKGWSKSKITRLALQDYLFTFGASIHYIITSGQEYKFLLECLNEDQLRELGIRGCKIAERFRSYLIKDFMKFEGEQLKYSLKSQINLLMRNMFKISFENIKTIWKTKWFILYGDHQLGRNFSIFFKYFMTEYIKPFDYVILKENIEDSKVMLEFHKRSKVLTS